MARGASNLGAIERSRFEWLLSLESGVPGSEREICTG